jgi:hypothetical protein
LDRAKPRHLDHSRPNLRLHSFHISSMDAHPPSMFQLLTEVQVQIFSCIPISAAWDVELMPVMCIDVASFMHAQAGINVFTDVVLLLYPLPLLPLLKFNKRQRSKHLSSPTNH